MTARHLLWTLYNKTSCCCSGPGVLNTSGPITLAVTSGNRPLGGATAGLGYVTVDEAAAMRRAVAAVGVEGVEGDVLGMSAQFRTTTELRRTLIM